MDSVIDMSSARALVGDAALWPIAKAFLWDFATQIDRTWLEGMPRVEELMSSSRVKRHVLDELGVEPVLCLFPKGDWSRLALLDGWKLLSIAKWLGAIKCADSLRSVTNGAQVRALKAALPGVYPEVFSFTAYFRGLGCGATGVSADDIVATGLGLLFSCLSDVDGKILKRVVLKLPKPLSDRCVPGVDGKDRPAALQALRQLLKLKFPEAYKLCC